MLGHRLNATLWLRVAPTHLERLGEELVGHAEVAFAVRSADTPPTVICRTRAPRAIGVHVAGKGPSVRACADRRMPPFLVSEQE
jgi:hypothetical protein